MMEGLALQADKALLDAVFDGVAVIDLKTFRVSLANQAAANILGFDSPDDMTGMEALKYISQNDRERVSGLLADVASGVCLQEGTEVRALNKQGKEIWVLARGVKMASNGSSLLLASFRDITAQKLMEIALREAERTQLDLLNISHESILISQNWKIVFANRHLQEVMGLSMGSLVGLSILDIVHPDDRQALGEHYQRIMNGEFIPSDDEFRGTCKDGKLAWGIIREVPFTWQGKPAVMALIRDITEKKKREADLKSGEERFRDLLENAHESVLVIQDWKVAYVNRKYEEGIGLPRDAVIGMHILDLAHPDERQTVMERYQKITNGEIYSASALLRGKDSEGNTKWADTRDISLVWEGKPAVMSMMVDITQQKLAEQALLESERRYRLVAENASDVIWTTDMDLNVTYRSPSFARLLRCTTEEVMTLTMQDLLTPESLEVGMKAFREQLALEGREGVNPQREWTLELQMRRRDGSIVWVEERTNFIRDADGRLSGLIGITRNISERKATQVSLEQSEQKYRALAEQSMQGIVIAEGAKMRIVYCNKTMADMLGYTVDEMLSMDAERVWHIVYPDDRDTFFKRFADRAMGLPSEGGYECRAIRKDGSVLWFESFAGKVDYQGKPAVQATFVDVTERKRVEEALKASQANYRDLFENTLVGLEVIDAETKKVILANQSICRMFGFKSPQDMVGINPLEYVLPEDLDCVVSRLTQVLSDPNIQEVATLRTRTEDGRIIWVTGMAAHFKYMSRPSILLSLVDVTAVKEADLKVEESEEKNRLLIDNAAEGIAVIQDGMLKFANPKCTEISGYTTAELLSKPFLEMVHPDDRQMMAENNARRVSGKEVPNNYRFRIVDKTGNTKWLQINTVQFRWENRPAVLSLLTDVTAHKEAEEALRASEEKYRGIFDESVAATYIFDAEKHFIATNQAGIDLLGYSQKELLQMSMADVDADPVAMLPAQEELLSGGRLVNYEHCLRRKDGTIITVLNNSRPLTDSDGCVVSIQCTLLDITKRREAEDALRESESRYRLLAENVSDVIWSVNLRSKRSFFSPSVTRLLGYTLEEAQSLNMKAVMSPTSYHKAMMVFSIMTAKDETEADGRSSSAQVEVELMRKDGSFIWVDTSITCLRDKDGRSTEIFGVIRDITQRKKAEDALRTSEEYFRALIENAWDAIAIVDASGTILYESPSSVRILGYEPKEIVGKNLVEFVRPEDAANMRELFRKFRNEPGAIVMVYVGIRHKEGHYLECEGTLQNLLHDRKINGIVANYRDVTDRRRAEEAICTSEERFRNLVEVTSDWVWEVDSNGVYTYVSPKVREVMGYEVSEIIGKSIFDLMPVKESSRFSKVFQLHAAEKRPFSFLESSRLHKDGRVIIVETSGIPFFREDGSLLGYRGIGRDITNRKRVERDLEESLKKVEKTMEASIQAISYTMETRDPYTTGHQRRVTQLACAIAREMGVSQWRIDGIRVAGLLHDIGKIAVPTEILSKPGKLSEIEFSMIKAHPKVGFDILKNVEFDWPIARIVVQHHERLDGSGYPAGIRGREILQEARILAVADVVEAMSSHRPYRPALGIEKALEEVARGEGTLYDPEVVRACDKVINEQGFRFER